MARRTISGDPNIGVAYVRVSTEDQKLGPQAQRTAIKAWADREGVEVAAWCSDEGVSGAADVAARPGLVAALGALREHGAGVLVIAKRDRLARDVVIAGLIEREARAGGARVVSADGAGNGDTPADQLMRTLLDGTAAYERALIRQRTRAALQAKRARGERAGAIPYGYHLAADGKRLEEDAAEQAVMAEVRSLRGAGLSIRAIRDACAAAGLVSRAGRPFGIAQIHRMLKREAA